MKRRDRVFARLLILVTLALVVVGVSSCVSNALAPTATSVPTRSAQSVRTLTATPVPTPTPTPDLPGDGTVRGWAVLAEKDDYKDVKMTDLPMDYVNIALVRQQLLAAGWPEDRIRELRGFDQGDLREGVEWLSTNADEDDVVLFYVFAHGKFLREVVRWGEFFAADWATVRSERRVLVVDSCQAELLTNAVKDDPRPHLSVAAVNEDEYGWAGLEEEGLPIVGAVFTHYFAEALGNPEADADGDGRVSLQEAARHAEGAQRTYMHEVVLVVPEFLEMYHKLGVTPEDDPGFPHVVVDDAVGEPVYLSW